MGWGANPIAAIGRARAGKPMTMKQMVKKMGAGQARAPSHLQRAYNTIRELRVEIKSLKAQIATLKKMNKAQKPMKTDQVNQGTYEYYDAGLRRILMILNTNGNWATTLVPDIRAEVNGLLGTNSQWRKK